MTQPPPVQPPYAAPPPNHPQAVTVLVLGILGLVVCGILGPFAWVMGNRVVGEIDASHGAMGGRSEANVGRILGIVATVLIAVMVLIVVVVLVFAVGVGVTSSGS